jgi:hypothetical protein
MPGVTDLPNTNGHHCYATSYKYTARCVNVYVQSTILLVVRSSQIAPSHPSTWQLGDPPLRNEFLVLGFTVLRSNFNNNFEKFKIKIMRT